MTGIPPMRPVFLEFPTITNEQNNTDYLFMFGPSLLIKPATMLDDEREYVDIYLPGVNLTWFDFFTHLPYQSNYPSRRPTLVPSYANTEDGQLPRPPVYAFGRGGSIIAQKD